MWSSDNHRSISIATAPFLWCGVIEITLIILLCQAGMAQQRHEETKRQAAETLVAEAGQLREEWRATALESAIKKYAEARLLWHELGLRREEAQALKDMGNVFSIVSEYQEALNSLTDSLELYRRLGGRSDECEVLNDIGRVYLSLGKHKQAIDYSRRALLLNGSRNMRVEAEALNNVADASSFMGDFSRVSASLDRALPLWQSLDDHQGQAHAFDRMASLLGDQGEMQKALELRDRALSLWRSAKNPQGEASTLTAIGSQLTFIGEYDKSLNSHRQALTIFQTIGDRKGEANAIANIGYTYFNLGDLDKALSHYEQAATLYGQISNHYYEATIIADLGDVYSLTGDNRTALEKYKAALSILHAAADRQWEALILNSMGSVYSILRDDRQALTAYNEALPLFRELRNQRWEANTLNGLGSVYLKLGQTPKARTCFDKALSLGRAAGDLSGEALARYNLAHVERASGDLEKAFSQVDEGLRINEALRSKVMSQQSRASYLASVHQYYEFEIDLLMQMHRRRPGEKFDVKAFEVSEHTLARSLIESLNEARADIREGANPLLLDREKSLQQALNAKADQYAQFLAGRDNAAAEAIAKEIDQLAIQYDEVKTQIRVTSRRYAALTQQQPLSLREAQEQVLDDDSILLEYALGDERSYAWLVTRAEVTSYELPGRAEIEGAARRYYDLVTANQVRKGETFQDRQARVQRAEAQLPGETIFLSHLLLSPMASKLGRKRLLIIPDGALQYIPFEALTVAAGTGANDLRPNSQDDQQRPLILDHEIVNEPSASALAVVLRASANRKPAPKSVAILADPVFDLADSRITSPPKGSLPAALTASPNGEGTRAFRDVSRNVGEIPRLLSSREEAEAIMSVVPWRTGFKAVDFQANRATAMGSNLGQFSIVHFATHALLDNEHPELSGIVLSLVDQNGQHQDGFLRLHDIYNLKLPVDLVVLSACQTGLGKDVKGEGLIGLTRGFMYAGASGVVASLWKVDDEATAVLMKLFYRGMFEKGLSPAAALRDAQLAMRQQKRWHEPYYWAGFVIQGQYAGKNSMKRTRNVESAAVLGSIGMVLSLSIIYLLWRRRKRIL